MSSKMNSTQVRDRAALLEMMKSAAAQGEVDPLMIEHAALLKSVVAHFESFPNVATLEDILLAVVHTAFVDQRSRTLKALKKGVHE